MSAPRLIISNSSLRNRKLTVRRNRILYGRPCLNQHECGCVSVALEKVGTDGVFDHCRDSQPEVVFSGSRTTFDLTSGLPIPVSIFSTHNVMVALHDYIWETNFEAFKMGESSEKIPPHRNQRGRKPGSKRRQVRAKQQSLQYERMAALRGVAGRQSHSRWSWEKDRAWIVTQPLRMGRRLGMCSSPDAQPRQDP